MKSIYNWDKATVCDIEADNLLDEATTVHVLSYKLNGEEISSLNGVKEKGRIAKFFKYHIDNKIPIVGHNFITYDVPLIEKIYRLDLSDLMVIDTLTLSWYLNVDRKSHGLDSFLQDYGVKKPEIDDWENLSYEKYKHRCQEDVKINYFLWEDLKARLIDMYSLSKVEIDSGLVGGKRVSEDEVIFIDSLKGLSVEEHINRILTFLMFKTDVQAVQERTKWDVDEEYLRDNIAKLEVLVEASAKELESVMPPVPVYRKVKEPAKKFKKDGNLSVAGESWKELLDKYNEDKEAKDKWGNLLIEVREVGCFHVLCKYEEPNINSHTQVKDFLFMHGWKPETFEFKRDKEAFDEWIKKKPVKGSHFSLWEAWKRDKPIDRAIPQVRVDGKDGKELCESVARLAEEVPEIRYLEEYSVIKHRLDTLKGIEERVKDGKVVASWHGFTNTLRVAHMAPAVNLPAVSKKYAEPIRGCLIAKDGYISLGSDLSSLENRVAHHFMIPHDPEFVETMSADGYDPHILMALSANLITPKEYEDFKNGITTPKVSEARQQGKTAGYAVAYGGMPASIARGAGVSMEVAESLYDAYWELNWSIKAVAEEQVIIKCSRGLNWLVNPLNGFLYNIRSDKDVWNTLCQGSGSYLFDCWVDKHLTKQKEKWGKCTQTAAFHDEVVIVFKDTPYFRKTFEGFLKDGIKEVSEEYKLRRELGCDCQFGKRYSEIH